MKMGGISVSCIATANTMASGLLPHHLTTVFSDYGFYWYSSSYVTADKLREAFTLQAKVPYSKNTVGFVLV